MGWRSGGLQCRGAFLACVSVCLSLACGSHALPAFPEGWIPEEAELYGRTDGAVASLPPEGLRGAGAGRGVSTPHFCSELQLLPVFTFRTNTFLWWPGSSFIFETSVSKAPHLRVVVAVATGGLFGWCRLWEVLRGLHLARCSPAPRAAAWALLAWPEGGVSVRGSGLGCPCCLSA